MCLNPVFLPGKKFPIACGRCVECLMNKSREWAFRLSMEAKMHDESCVLTLTYDDGKYCDVDKETGELIPEYVITRKNGKRERVKAVFNELRPCEVGVREVQLFIKRLRKHLCSTKIKYFACGEYGSENSRPHYHVIIFGWAPKNTYIASRKVDKHGRYKCYCSSHEVEKFWKRGNIVVDPVDSRVAKYCAKYLQKQVKGRQNAFLIMSKSEPLGYSALNDVNIATDKLYVDGKYIKLPNAFLKYMDKHGQSEVVQKIRQNRYKTSFASFWKAQTNEERAYHVKVDGDFLRRPGCPEYAKVEPKGELLDYEAYKKYVEFRQKRLADFFGVNVDILLSWKGDKVFHVKHDNWTELTREEKYPYVPLEKKFLPESSLARGLVDLCRAPIFTRIYVRKLPFSDLDNKIKEVLSKNDNKKGF